MEWAAPPRGRPGERGAARITAALAQANDLPPLSFITLPMTPMLLMPSTAAPDDAHAIAVFLEALRARTGLSVERGAMEAARAAYGRRGPGLGALPLAVRRADPVRTARIRPRHRAAGGAGADARPGRDGGRHLARRLEKAVSLNLVLSDSTHPLADWLGPEAAARTVLLTPPSVLAGDRYQGAQGIRRMAHDTGLPRHDHRAARGGDGARSGDRPDRVAERVRRAAGGAAARPGGHAGPGIPSGAAVPGQVADEVDRR